MIEYTDALKEAAAKRPVFVKTEEQPAQPSVVEPVINKPVEQPVPSLSTVKTMIKDLPIVKNKNKIVKKSKYMNDMFTVQKL